MFSDIANQTGASMGIGEAIVHTLAAAGARLALFSRSKDKLAELARKLESLHKTEVIYKAVDVGDHERVDEAIASVVKEMGDIAVLINNVYSIPTLSTEPLDTDIEVNTRQD